MKIKFLCLSSLLICGVAWASPWGQNMQSLFQSLQELLVLTGDDSRYLDLKNSARIESAAEALAKSAHSVAAMTEKSPDADPSIGIFGTILQDEARRGLEAFQSGHREYARGVFKNLASTCVACHSRSPAGLKLQWNFSSGFAQGLSLLQQAELLAAGRSFDSALTALEKVIADGDLAKKRPSEWNRALRFALAISVRVERNPSRSLALLEKALSTGGIPQFSKLDIQDWTRALQTWKREKDSKKTEPSSESELHREALRLLKLAKAAQRYPMDRAGDVFYLRATSLLHQQLQVAPTGTRSGDAFMELGIAYEVLRDFGLWNLGDIYFEACIHRSPHTQTAETCYRFLEESVIAGYTGSAGTSLPESVQKRLGSLRQLSSAKETGKTPR